MKNSILLFCLLLTISCKKEATNNTTNSNTTTPNNPSPQICIVTPLKDSLLGHTIVKDHYEDHYTNGNITYPLNDQLDCLIFHPITNTSNYDCLLEWFTNQGPGTPQTTGSNLVKFCGDTCTGYNSSNYQFQFKWLFERLGSNNNDYCKTYRFVDQQGALLFKEYTIYRKY